MPSHPIERWLVVLGAVLIGAAVEHSAAPALAAEWKGFVAAPEEAIRLPPPRVAEGLLTKGDMPDDATSGVDLVRAEESSEVDPCDEEAEDCRTALDKLFEDRLASVDLDIRVGGHPGNDYPCECRLEGETYEPRRFSTTTFTWTAAGYCHKPLYFEDWMLERYGHSYGPLADPFLSGAHFFVTLPVLPYKMGTELPWECVYPLGYYRPGNCAPWTVAAVPISARGFAVQAATVTGLVFLFP